MIAITENAEGSILPVRAQPGARKAGVVGEHAGALKIAISAPAEDGRANKALCEVLQDALRLRISQVELLKGARSRNKLFLIRGIAKATLIEKLESIVDR